MTENRASSGVRNLRAMFETQSATSSPEPRGRSPARKINPDTPKVKASFVSVGPTVLFPQQLGTTKGTAENSPEAHRRESFSISKGLEEGAVVELKQTISQEKETRQNSADVAEVIPEQAVDSRPSSTAPPPIRKAEATMPNLGSIMKGSDFPEPQTAEEKKPEVAAPAHTAPAPERDAGKIEDKLAALSLADTPADNPDKIVTGAQEEASLKPADPKDEAAISGGQALPPPQEVLPSTNAGEAASAKPEVTEVEPSKSKPNGAAGTGTAGKAGVTKKPAAISTSKTSAPKATSSKSPLPRSPGAPNWPKTPTTPKAAPAPSVAKPPAVPKEQPKTSAPKESTKAPASKASRSSLRPSASSTTTGTAAKAKAPVTDNKKPAAKPATATATATAASASASAPKNSTSTSPGGFKKPRPKSPTRPVRLPNHLIAPTAASAAKHGDDASQKLARKPSNVSRPTVVKAAPPARKPASRASLAAGTVPGKRPESRTSTIGVADEGFLARMMRPTTSSASKTHEKPASPPRRGASVRGPAKPKAGQESTVAKGKRKVVEVASKAKEAVTNGHRERDHSQPAESAASDANTADPSGEQFQQTQPERETTPVEQVESSAVELQTPHFEGQAIR